MTTLLINAEIRETYKDHRLHCFRQMGGRYVTLVTTEIDDVIHGFNVEADHPNVSLDAAKAKVLRKIYQ